MENRKTYKKYYTTYINSYSFKFFGRNFIPSAWCLVGSLENRKIYIMYYSMYINIYSIFNFIYLVTTTYLLILFHYFLLFSFHYHPQTNAMILLPRWIVVPFMHHRLLQNSATPYLIQQTRNLQLF